MISDVDLIDWLDSEYESPIPQEIIDELVVICQLGTCRAQVQKFVNVIGLLTLKFKPESSNINRESSKSLTYWPMLPDFTTMPLFSSLSSERNDY